MYELKAVFIFQSKIIRNIVGLLQSIICIVFYVKIKINQYLSDVSEMSVQDILTLRQTPCSACPCQYSTRLGSGERAFSVIWNVASNILFHVDSSVEFG